MAKKKKLQDELLFDDQNLVTPDAPSDSAPAIMDDEASLRLLHTMEQIITNFGTVKSSMSEFDELMNRLRGDMARLSEDQKAFVEQIEANYRFDFHMSQKSQDEFRGIIKSELDVAKKAIHDTTSAEITRLKHAYGDEEDNIDVLRLRWWPHGYILIIIIEILFCSNLFLLLKVLGI